MHQRFLANLLLATLMCAAAAAAELPQTLDLATAQRVALEQSPSLMAVAERVEQARLGVQQSRSRYFPQVSANYTAAHTELADSTVREARLNAATGVASGYVLSKLTQALGGMSFGTQTFPSTVIDIVQARNAVPTSTDSYSAGITASFLLFDGFNREYSHAIAKYGRAESEEGLREARRLLLEAVAQSFHGVQLARENVAINEADAAYNERLLKDATARRRVGAGSKSDVLNFEVALRGARAALIAARSQYQGARIALAALMGLPEARLPENTRLVAMEDLPQHMDMPEEEALVAKAMTLRPDIAAGELGVKRAGAGVGQARAAFYPAVALSASHDARSEDSGSFRGDDFGTTVAITGSMDLFTGGRNRAALNSAKSAHRAARQDLKYAEIQAVADVRQAIVSVAAAQQQLALQRENAEYVRQNRDLVEKEYQAGQGALARLNQAQRDLISAQGRLALARVDLRQAWHTLATATGQSLEPFETAAD